MKKTKQTKKQVGPAAMVPLIEANPAAVPGVPAPLDHSLLGPEGMVAGAAAGAIGGPAGVVAGMAIGGMVGALAAEVLDSEERRARKHEAKLDLEIGVVGGDLGEASPDQPPARIGAYSAGASGAPSDGGTPAEGPIQEVGK